MPVATIRDRVGIYNEELPSTNSLKPLITWFCKVTLNIRSLISTATRPMVTKLGKLVTYYEKLPPTKLQ